MGRKGPAAESFLDAYKHIDARVLLLHATKPHDLDMAREKGIRIMEEEIIDVTIISVEAGHMLQWDEPEKVAAEIFEFANK